MKNLFLVSLSIVLFSCSNQSNNEVSQENNVWHKNATIYEVNVRQFTPEGTFNAFLPHIDRIHNMGIDILWFMPIHPIGEVNRKGELGSYYSVKDYKGVNQKIVIIAHNAVTSGFIVVMMLLLFGVYKYFCRQWKDHAHHWSTEKFIFGTSKCRDT